MTLLENVASRHSTQSKGTSHHPRWELIKTYDIVWHINADRCEPSNTANRMESIEIRRMVPPVSEVNNNNSDVAPKYGAFILDRRGFFQAKFTCETVDGETTFEKFVPVWFAEANIFESEVKKYEHCEHYDHYGDEEPYEEYEISYKDLSHSFRHMLSLRTMEKRDSNGNRVLLYEIDEGYMYASGDHRVSLWAKLRMENRRR